MSYRETDHLRVLIANERKDHLALVAPIVAALGHEVIAREIEVIAVTAIVGCCSTSKKSSAHNRASRLWSPVSMLATSTVPSIEATPSRSQRMTPVVSRKRPRTFVTLR